MKKRASKKKRKQTGHEMRSIAAVFEREQRRCPSTGSGHRERESNRCVKSRGGRESLSCRKAKR